PSCRPPCRISPLGASCSAVRIVSDRADLPACCRSVVSACSPESHGTRQRRTGERGGPPGADREAYAAPASFWALPADEVLRLLGAGPGGLTEDEAAHRLTEFGSNRLAAPNHAGEPAAACCAATRCDRLRGPVQESSFPTS